MLITHPEKNQSGFMIHWIMADHHPGPDEEYEAALAHYGCEVYDDLNEARRRLKEHVKKSEVFWGTITEVYFRYIDGLPHDWEDCDPAGAPLHYAEELFDEPD